MSNSKIILLDIDGVLADFVGATLVLFGRPDVFVDRWNFHAQIGVTSNDMWRRIDAAGQSFWENMPLLPWARDVVGIANRHETLLCTSPTLSDSCNSGKIAWIRRNFPEFHRRFMITPCKHLLRGDFLLIDDSDENIEKFSSIWQPAILFPQPWNKNREHCYERIEYLKREIGKIL